MRHIVVWKFVDGGCGHARFFRSEAADDLIATLDRMVGYDVVSDYRVLRPLRT